MREGLLGDESAVADAAVAGEGLGEQGLVGALLQHPALVEHHQPVNSLHCRPLQQVLYHTILYYIILH